MNEVSGFLSPKLLRLTNLAKIRYTMHFKSKNVSNLKSTVLIHKDHKCSRNFFNNTKLMIPKIINHSG